MLVFGAGSSGEGLSNGQAASLAYARAGATLVAVDRNGDAAEVTSRMIRDEGGVAYPLVADVSDTRQIEHAIREAVAVCGSVDVLHNNVGILELGGLIEMDEAAWDRAFDINVRAAYTACRCVVPLMVERGRGVITNVSSIASTRWVARPMVTYSCSKAALNQLTRSVALEFAGQGIRCNAILPGLIDTPMVSAPYAALHGGVEAMRRARHASCPTGRMGTAWDVAHAAVFLASDEAAYINGVLLPVDGGLSCKAF